ncbi:aldo/keto reductase [Streptomyces sp. NPDC007157]|uniref:aldo/keto reductase n=1 Tax=Streptomyces sp. NPDC007157 TaxID=3154681 RepID=UPI00340968D4
MEYVKLGRTGLDVSPICLGCMTVGEPERGHPSRSMPEDIGASSMYAWQFSKALHLQKVNGWARFVSMQGHYNLLNREEEREMLPLGADQGIGVIPWSPLARGRLTRDWDTVTDRSSADPIGSSLYGATEAADKAVVEKVAKFAAARDISRAQVALAWLLRNPVVSAPVAGAGKPGHLEDAIASLDVSLTHEEVAELEAPCVPHPVVGIS